MPPGKAIGCYEYSVRSLKECVRHPFLRLNLREGSFTLDKKAIFREFRKYVSLSVFEMICMSIYIIADTFFIALALGANGLAALNISIISFTVVHSLGLMIGIGGATKYTITKSRGEDAKSVFTHSLVAGLVVSIVLMLIGIFFTVPISEMLGADSQLLPMVTEYIKTILIFAPLLILKNTLLSFIRNDGNPKLAMAGTVVGATSNIVLDYILLFPLAMGMLGAALATVFSLIFSIIVLSFHFWTKRNKFGIYKCKINFRRIKELAALGASTFVNEITVAIALVIFNLVILGVEGNVGVAAYGIVMNLAIVVLSIFTGIALGIQPLISKGHGSGDVVLVRVTMKYAIIAVSVLSVFAYAIMYLNASAIVSMFNSEGNSTLAILAADGLQIYFVGLIFAGINVITAAFFSAANSPKTALSIAVLRSCILIIPLLLILSRLLGMDGVWISFVATELVVLLLSVIFLLKKFRVIRSGGD